MAQRLRGAIFSDCRSVVTKNNYMNKPLEMSMAEWDEVMQLPEVREAWGIEAGETPEQFSNTAYGVKFKFSPSIAPGYSGDLYILHGDALGEPMTFIREDGKLVLVG